MDWIKKNPAQLSLAVVAILAIAAVALLYTNVSAFDSAFESARGGSVSKAQVEKPDFEWIDEAQKSLDVPVKWQPTKEEGRLFVSDLYVIKDGKLSKPEGGMFQPPVANEWLQRYNLDELNATTLGADPDEDGFTNLEEWNGLDGLSHLDNLGRPVSGPDGQPLPNDSTDPKDPKSHPAYSSKLSLVKVHNIPFLLRLMSWDANPKEPNKPTVQLNTVVNGVGKGKTFFLVVGEDIPNSKFKTVAFKKVELPGKDGTTKDASVLTVENKETGEKVELPLGQVVDSPDSYAVLRYVWAQPGTQHIPDFAKRRGDKFKLPPEEDKEYTVTEIQGKVPQSATIEFPDGTKKTLTPAP